MNCQMSNLNLFSVSIKVDEHSREFGGGALTWLDSGMVAATQGIALTKFSGQA
jgi:hypothetical protein